MLAAANSTVLTDKAVGMLRSSPRRLAVQFAPDRMTGVGVDHGLALPVGQRLPVSCALRGWRTSCVRASPRNSRKAQQARTLLRIDRGPRRHRFDDISRLRQLAAEIAHCVTRPSVRDNYVEFRLTALAPEPRNASITAPGPPLLRIFAICAWGRQRPYAAVGCSRSAGILSRSVVATRE